MPLDLADGASERESKNTARIRKVAEGKGYEEALAATPPESPLWMRGWRMAYQGKSALILAIPAFVMGLAWGNGPIGLRLGSVLAYALAAFGVVRILIGSKLRTRATQAGLLKRSAYIQDRRSETTLRGWGGETRYYFLLEFEDGGIAEFGMDGRGTGEEPYPSGIFGVAYTRGQELLDFQQIRV
jgi:hypothetical protein